MVGKVICSTYIQVVEISYRNILQESIYAATTKLEIVCGLNYRFSPRLVRLLCLCLSFTSISGKCEHLTRKENMSAVSKLLQSLRYFKAVPLEATTHYLQEQYSNIGVRGKMWSLYGMMIIPEFAV
jgi:hypothetical protein